MFNGNQSLADYMDERFISSPDRIEVSAAITAELLGIPLIGDNIKPSFKEIENEKVRIIGRSSGI